ncbi:hypothetical protein CDL15_Pgr013288 [Punica granatum]|uniref:Uncharacterized protein n=1 Tax=Punica granatum TaxID=22663 RepID=A0A218WNG9_PUNGR|nr:hypothetical protein CDL15_Pgr013288 [Punica granatum]
MGCWSGDGIRGVGSCRDDCEWGEDFDEGEGARMGEGLGELEKGWSCEREGFVPVFQGMARGSDRRLLGIWRRA